MTKKKKVLAIVVGLVMLVGLALVPYTGMVKEAQASTTYQVTITVLQHDGSNTPVPGAGVNIKKSGSNVAWGTTGSDGIAEFGGTDDISLANGTYKCTVWKGPGSNPNHVNAAVNTFTVDNAAVTHTQYLTEFEVKVLQHDGSNTPVPGAKVKIKKGNANVALLGKTGSDGIAEFGPSTGRADNIWLRDATYKCYAYKGPGSNPNFVNTAVNTFTVGATPVTQQTQYLTKFTVQVKNNGAKVNGARVRLSKKDLNGPYLTSVGQGKYETWLGDGRYKFEVSSGVIRLKSPNYNVPPTTFVTCNLGATWN